MYVPSSVFVAAHSEVLASSSGHIIGAGLTREATNFTSAATPAGVEGCQ